jgi:Icc-related predicted phosphoesterase
VLIVSDVHGAFDALRRVAASGEPLLVLGDLLNYVDYRTLDGMLAEVAGRQMVAETVALRAAGDEEAASARWRAFTAGREAEIRATFAELTRRAYQAAGAALEGCEAYVTYGNVDRPDLLRAALPPGTRFLDGDVVEIDGLRVGVVGGGVPTRLGTPGEVAEEEMAAKLAGLGRVDVLGSHVPPAVGPLSSDVIGGRVKGSPALLRYLEESRPAFHYFGDVHQPQATRWRVGATTCVNAGYFRATGRAVRHG